MYLKKFNNYKIVFSIKVLKLKGHNKKNYTYFISLLIRKL
jgi:hypothetical protein